MWTPVKEDFRSTHSLTFGSDLLVPKQNFLLFLFTCMFFVLGADQFPLEVVLTHWELPTVTCSGSPPSYVPLRHKMLKHCVVSGDHWPCLVEWTGERKGWNNVQADTAILNKITSMLALSSWFFKPFPHYIFSFLHGPWKHSLYPTLSHTAALQSVLPPLLLLLMEKPLSFRNSSSTLSSFNNTFLLFVFFGLVFLGFFFFEGGWRWWTNIFWFTNKKTLAILLTSERINA